MSETKSEKIDEKDREESKLPSCVLPGENINIGMLVDKIVTGALEQRASDIHFEPREEDMVIRYRVDGMLIDTCTLTKELANAVVFKIKVMAKLQTDERFIPQDGRIEFNLEKNKFSVRVSILPITNGEKVVFRLLTDIGRDFTLEDLGFAENEVIKLKKNFTKPYGMIIATGPTGSGKTTTLYTMLKIISSREKNIVTIEDPVEYSIEGVNHVQVHNKANMTFSVGLRAILRQDPDVIMVGEIRDSETARIAINAAMTGHLVFSTLHTNDSVSSIPRLV
ncbi:MAG TPA: type II/IV secretion system protein, partial [bacterium]|nr:type II/IV secretion system protein [bacterium]